ncbi:MAG TPA: hypothetical protein VJH92_06625 [Candidatus Nanoarchaeia archaeon]|nr:hypothetical protein [Candidatus Nanoarchaeia archaeon]
MVDKKFNLRSKKANITITILVISVVLLCGLALTSFVLFKTRVVNLFTGVFMMEELNSQIEDYGLNKDLSRVDSRVNGNGERVLYQERREDYGIWFWNEERIVLSVEYPL